MAGRRCITATEQRYVATVMARGVNSRKHTGKHMVLRRLPQVLWHLIVV